ncbi:MAG: helix-turn-helix domain-containing protein [Reichenbachiella sp.]|uniref:helix-turn-helix domain-containing protein n=1 Tax=Reichenbachiella sp. TaxID=2184521 RepID=UPI003262EA9F
MIVKKIYPRLLKEELAYIYVFQDDGKTPFENHKHLPDGTFDLIIHYGEPLRQKTESNQYKVLPNIRVAGGHNHSFPISYPGHFTIFAVVFKPAHASYFMPGLKDIAVDKNVRAEDIFGQEILNLAEHISGFSCFEDAALAIESFLIQKRVAPNNFYTPQIDYAVQLMQNQKMNVSNICREIGMSERNFRRVFRNLTGFSPRKILQLKRVRALSRILNERAAPHAQLERLGYYDLSHLIHDFKAVTNLTPQQYISNLDRIDTAFHQAHRQL